MKILLTFLILFCLQSGCRQKSVEESGRASADMPSDTVVAVFALPAHDSLFIDSILNATRFFHEQAERVKSFYALRKYHVAWFNDHGVSEQTGEVVNLINDYLEAGVVDSSVFMKGIGAIYDSLTVEGFSVRDRVNQVLAADVIFTGQFFAFSDKAWKGRYADRLRDLEWFLPLKKFVQEEYLDSLLRLPPSAIQGSEPVFVQYHALRKKLKELVEIQRSGGWAPLHEPGHAIARGDTTPQAIALRKRLGLPELQGPNAYVYDSLLVVAVSVFQECYGLPPTGITDKKTIKEMNVPVEARIRSIMINLERWKWIPADAGNSYIAVNIPEFMLHVFEKGKEVWDMKVIVGKNASRTVIFSGNMKYVVLAPYWNIPRSIVVNEILPAMKSNPNYLVSHKMEVVLDGREIPAASINWKKYNKRNFPYQVRQKPGEHNSLGQVKFLFPNSYAIYLHDTPSKWLFEKEERNFSHGCIRVSEPEKLAMYLLRNDSNWDSDKIRSAMNGNKETSITLENPVPVYITYFTSWVDSKGRLNFREDIYGHDKKLNRMLFNETEPADVP